MKKIYLLIIVALVSCKPKEVNVTKIGTPLFEGIEGMIQDKVNNIPLVIFAKKAFGIMVAFDRRLNEDTVLKFVEADLSFPKILKSNDGTVWNIFGEAIEGPLLGKKLINMNGQMGYWFCFATTYPIINIYGGGKQNRIEDSYNNSEWLIDPNLVKSGAIKDGIPSIDLPNFISINASNKEDDYALSNQDLVIVLSQENSIKVYPTKILDWHEIVNDFINTTPVVVTYCPLTGTSDAWERTIDGKVSEFGVSGLLYNNNLLPYDRATNSLWSQILKKSINGDQINTVTKQFAVIEMTWLAAKKLSQEFLLLSQNTGYTRDYSYYPYGDYKDSDNLLFPITYDDPRFLKKTRVMNIVIDAQSKVYSFSE